MAVKHTRAFLFLFSIINYVCYSESTFYMPVKSNGSLVKFRKDKGTAVSVAAPARRSEEDDHDHDHDHDDDHDHYHDDEYDDEHQVKIILLWAPGFSFPFSLLGTGSKKFFENNCTYSNCWVTEDKHYYRNIESFDAILFHGYDDKLMSNPELPKKRSPRQKYVFAGLEPAQSHLVCSPVYDNFFNWTWTYRLDSDLRWGYVEVYEKKGARVGPQINMDWRSNMQPIDESNKVLLKKKSKAAVWYRSMCKTVSRREEFAHNLTLELEKYNLTVDTLGNCSTLRCPFLKSCDAYLMRTYYFYFAFEDTISIDYVTERILKPMNLLIVPIVLGGADYSRFLPPGSYLNALDLGIERLAQMMNEIITGDKSRYYDFFRWKNYYEYKESENGIDICNICAALNDPYKVKTVSTHKDFRKWWNEGYHDLCNNTESKF